MSGRKRATLNINDQMRQQLAAAEARLAQVEGDYAQVSQQIAEMQARRSREIAQAQAEAQAVRQQAVNEALVGVSLTYQALEAQAKATLAEQAQALQHSFDEQCGLLWQDSAAWMAQQAEQQAAVLETSLAAHEARVHKILAQDRSRTRQRQNIADLAWEASQAAQRLYGALHTGYPGSIAASEGAWFELALHTTAENMEAGAFEAALSGAQQVYLQLQRLHFTLEAAAQRQEMLRQATLNRVWGLLDQAEAQREIQALGLKGEVLDVRIDVDAWSQGRSALLRRRLRQLARQCASAAPGSVDWEEMLQTVLPGLQTELEQAAQQARRSVLASQLRFSVAQRVALALQSEGFGLQGGWYTQDDQRLAYQAQLCNYAGETVELRVSAGANDALQTRLDLAYGGEMPPDEHSLRRQAQEIWRALQQAGLEVGLPLENAPAQAVQSAVLSPASQPEELLPQPIIYR